MKLEPTVTGIVLAGGRSRRFGSDKLAAEIGGRSVLASTIQALERLVDGVTVAGPSLPDDLARGETPITLLHDVAPYEGPLVAIANALESMPPAFHHVAIVVGGDMPGLVPAVLARMLDVLDVDPTVDAVFLGKPDAAGTEVPTDAPLVESARRQVLPLVVRVQPASRVAREAVEAGHRSLQAFVDRIAAVELPAAAWTPLDPGAQTLADIDTPGDLDRLNAP